MTRIVVSVTFLEETSSDATRIAVISVVESDRTRLPLASSSSTVTSLAKPVPAIRSVVPVMMFMEFGSPASNSML